MGGINRFNSGRDVAIDFVGPAGAIRLNNITGWNRQQISSGEESNGIDGVDRFMFIPGGWRGTIALDRFDRNTDELIYQFEQLYYTGQSVPSCVITETINEPDGSQSQWRFEGVVFHMPDAGDWEQKKKVSQRLEWRASFRKRIL